MYNSDLPARAELPSGRQLLRSTVIAIIAAAVLLVTVVLPSEYGIDPTRIGRVLGLTRMGEIKMALAAEAERDRVADAARPAPEQAIPVATAPPARAAAESEGHAPRTDEMTVTLKPGEGAEVKLEMVKGATATYEWSTAGGAVNHDTHGEGANKAFISYKKGTQVDRDAGELTAAFDGSHGWFWRNRTNQDVTVTVKATGKYLSMKRVV
jgi:hypothetical protein